MNDIEDIEDDTELELLRAIRAEVDADPGALARVRTLLLASVPETVPKRQWGRPVAVGAAVLALGIGGALIVPPLAGGTAQPASAGSTATIETTSEAIEFADAAAKAVLLAAPLQPPPGKFLKVVSHEVDETASMIDIGSKGEILADYPMRGRTTISTYVPANPMAEWVRVTHDTFEPLTAPGRKFLAAHPEEDQDYRHVERAQFGAFAEAPDQVAGDHWKSPTKDFLDMLPRDPDDLLDVVKAPTWAFDPLVQLTSLARPLGVSWLEDAKLRAAIYGAIGRIEGVEVETNVTLGEVTGTALRAASVLEPEEYAEAVFDPVDYHLVGFREYRVHQGVEVVTKQTTYSSVVVDEAP